MTPGAFLQLHPPTMAGAPAPQQGITPKAGAVQLHTKTYGREGNTYLNLK